MSKVALIIIYNHQYNKNINVIEKLYAKRFKDIYHLVPFYNGDKINVISVYENSFYFQGYISQGLKTFFNEKYEHYFFIGDDLLLNPLINEDNYKTHLRLEDKTSFIPSILNLHEVDISWPRVREAYNFNRKTKGLEIESILPSYTEALSKFKKFDLKLKPLNHNQISQKPKLTFNFIRIIKCIKYYIQKWQSNLLKTRYNLPYPLVGSYSDIAVVSSDTIKDFSNLCGIFAASKLFVELAIPTSLVLSADSIVTESDLKLTGKALWVKEDFKILERYNKNLNSLLNGFPENHLYIHPIKLSVWK